MTARWICCLVAGLVLGNCFTTATPVRLATESARRAALAQASPACLTIAGNSTTIETFLAAPFFALHGVTVAIGHDSGNLQLYQLNDPALQEWNPLGDEWSVGGTLSALALSSNYVFVVSSGKGDTGGYGSYGGYGGYSGYGYDSDSSQLVAYNRHPDTGEVAEPDTAREVDSLMGGGYSVAASDDTLTVGGEDLRVYKLDKFGYWSTTEFMLLSPPLATYSTNNKLAVREQTIVYLNAHDEAFAMSLDDTGRSTEVKPLIGREVARGRGRAFDIAMLDDYIALGGVDEMTQRDATVFLFQRATGGKGWNAEEPIAVRLMASANAVTISGAGNVLVAGAATEHGKLGQAFALKVKVDGTVRGPKELTGPGEVDLAFGLRISAKGSGEESDNKVYAFCS